MLAFDGAKVAITGSTFVGSSAGGRGGAVGAVGASLYADNTAFINCTASGAGGGAIAAVDYQCYGVGSASTALELLQCTFVGCGAPNGAGGAVAVLAGNGLGGSLSLSILSSSFMG